ncbi:L-lactate permease [Arthrobacter sulfonylureivorans]|uniref:L-lactate permease n=1 Tax=Arthrobacter sulfonylureivorans TaxID=2486855 RepID=UPI0039E4C919
MQAINTLAAVSPIVLVAVLLAFRVGAFRSALIALSVTGVLTLTSFPIDLHAASQIGPSLGATTVTVIVIILAGILLAEMLNAAGSQHALAQWLSTAAHEPNRAMLMIGLGVAPFAEAIIGWGLGVIISVPLLVRIGYSVRVSATIGLLGILLGPWGSLAPGILIMSQLGGTDFVEQGVWTALLSLPCLLIMAAAMLLVGVGRAKALAMATETLLTVLLMWAVLIATNHFLGPPLAGVFSSMTAMLTILAGAKWRHRSPIRMGVPVVRALAPYLFLCSGLFAMSLVVKAVPVNTLLDVASGPAFWLTLTVAASPALLGMRRADLPGALRAGFARGIPVALTTTLFLAFGALLSMNGMSAQLANAAAGLGSEFIMLAPVAGFLGGYITGSNSASAAMFAAGFSDAANELGVDAVQVLGILNVAASAAVMVSPPRVALAVSLAQTNASGSESNTASATTATVTRKVLVANVMLAISLVVVAFNLFRP